MLDESGRVWGVVFLIDAIEPAADALPPGLTVSGKPLSEALASPLVDVYRVGGFGLAFLLVGSSLLSGAAFVDRGTVTYVLVAAGAVLVLVPCYFFYVKEVRPIGLARQAVLRNEELINELQEAALSTAQLGLLVQSVVYKHSRDINLALSTTRAQLRNIPNGFVKSIADQPAFASADTLATEIMRFSESAEKILRDVNAAILESDAGKLRKYLDEVAQLKTSLRELLVAQREGGG